MRASTCVRIAVADVMPRGDAAMVARLFHSPVQSGTATPLLAFVAGDFASAAARIWPAPHTGFYTLPTARRHAAAIILAGFAARSMPAAELRRTVEFARDAVVADALAAAPAPGLMRALSRAGEVQRTRAGYAIFLDLFADPMANEALRHMDEIRPATFAPIAVLPPALRVAPILRVLNCESAAADLALAFDLAVRMRRGESAGRIARRWAAGGDASALFGRAVDDLAPETFRTLELAPRLPASFERVTSRKQLERVALDFRNCLADHAPRIAEGRMAVYVWRGEPAAAIALNWDLAGWRLAEAKLADNLDLEEARLRELIHTLAQAGVRTGMSLEGVIIRLQNHAAGTPHYNSHQSLGFIERLALGDLWS
jgi:hypothetical protein